MDICLVHGSFHGAWCWDLLRPYLERRGHEAWPDVNSQGIVCDEDRAINPEWVRFAARGRLGVEAVPIGGGHSPFLTRPAELADLIDRLA